MKLLHFSSSYTLPAVLSLGAHAMLFVFIFWGWEATSTPKRVAPPKAIQATIVELESSSPAAAAPQPAQRTIDVAAQREEAERQRQAEQRRAEQQRQQQAERERREQERREQERAEQEQREAERRAQEQREAEQQRVAEQQRMQEAIAAEMEAERAMLEAEQNEAIAASYSSLVKDRIVRNWSRPPSAENNMIADLQIQLVPTGRVVGVTIIESSGDAAFDRSAERAVWKAEQFPELQQLPSIVFEQEFRQFTLRFNPQDLRR